MPAGAHKRHLLGVAIMAVGLGSSPAHTAQKPLWEFGLGVGAIAFNDYRGADSSHVYPLPVPYFVYRGKFLQADRNGLRGRLFDQDRIELNISGNATTPVRRNAARSAMPDLKPTVEVGPSLDIHLWKSADQRLKFDIRLPARAVFTVQGSPHGIGWLAAPNVSMDLFDAGGYLGWNLGLMAGPLFADRRYHDYFYTVAPQYATATRPAYQAHGGYSGSQLLASLTKRFPAYWVGGYVRHDFLQGATFDSSPLVKRTSYWSGGVAIAWIIKESSRRVEADE